MNAHIKADIVRSKKQNKNKHNAFFSGKLSYGEEEQSQGPGILDDPER